uniref:Uncharacterized protein n=1 Tax=Lepeophtheirus salmonis TaxID=72036 RepID=A0A0K2UIE4_LEPSM
MLATLFARGLSPSVRPIAGQ